MLSRPILVLNKSWAVVNVTTVKRAISLLYSGTAYAICPETYEPYDFNAWIGLHVENGQECIRTVRLVIRIPEIILLVNYDGYPSKGAPFSRKNIYKRDQYTCQYCGKNPGVSELTIDHILPRSRGGRSTWLNCTLACLECNKKKGNRTPPEAGMKLLRKPFKPKWPTQLSLPRVMVNSSWQRFIQTWQENQPI